MPNYIYLTDYQQKIVTADNPYTVVGHSAGSGTTFALIHAASNWCNNNPNKSVTFFANTARVNATGGVCDLAKETLLEDAKWKFSNKSNIFTLSNGAKIKFVSASQDVESTLALLRDFIIFDAACPDELIVFHLKRARKAIVVDYLLDMLESTSWARQYNLLLDDDSGFVPLINYIPATDAISNPVMVANNPTYIKWLEEINIKDRLRLTTTRF